MIVDCHTHIWPRAQSLDETSKDFLHRQAGRAGISADPSDHALSAGCVDKTLVFPALDGSAVSEGNRFVCEYVAGHSNAMVGIAAADPTDPGCVSAAEALLEQTEFRGLVISPSTQGFHPADTRAIPLYELAQQREVPLFFHQSTRFPAQAHLEYARPSLLDEVARTYPQLRIVLSALGQPWVDEALALLGKHPYVFADLAGLTRRPWQMYNSLIQAHQFNVIDKVLFGSGFPYLQAAQAIGNIYRLHELTQGTNLPGVPREALRSIIERDALTVLGISRPGERPADENDTTEDDE